MPVRTDFPTNELRLLDEESDRFAFFAWQYLTIIVWLAPPDAEAITRLARVGAERVRVCGSGLVDVHIVLSRIDFPDAKTRDILVAESRRAAPHLATVAIVVGGEGFWASAIRGFITSVHMLVPGRFQLRLFGGVNDLVEWLPDAHASKTGQPLDASQLRDVLQHVQNHVRKQGTHAA